MLVQTDSVKKAFAIGLILLFFLLLRLRYIYHGISNYSNGEKVVFAITMLSEPSISGKFQQFVARQEGKEQIFVTTTRFPGFHYGDALRISGKVQRKVLSNNRTIWTMSFPKITIVTASYGFLQPVLLAIGKVRQSISLLFVQSLPKTSASLLLGIVFGIKEGMPKDFMDNLRSVGVLHVIAASGMNVVMVGSFLSSFFALFLRRQVALFITILGIFFYAVFSGLEPSILRAAIMATFTFSSQMLGRQNFAFYGVVLAAYSMLFVSPSLLFDVGFQLSFASTIGLFLLRPLFETNARLALFLKKSLVGEDIATTISAQVATLPILLSNFGSYSLLSILVNALVLWTIPPLMVVGGIAAIVGLLFAELGKMMLLFALPLLLFFETIVTFFGKLGFLIHFDHFPTYFVIGYYLFLASIIVHRRQTHE